MNIDSTTLDKVNKPAPRWIWFGCVLLVITAALMAASKPVGGGDTWVAMACGRYTLGDWDNPSDKHPAELQGNRTWQMKMLDLFGIHITQVDPFSAKSRRFDPDIPGEIGWVNQNWLTHIVFYKMRDLFGENSIVVYKFIQAILTALFAYWAARVLGAHPTIAAVTAAFGMLLSRSFIDLRPNVSSILFAMIMIYLLARWRRGEHKMLAWMIPVTIIWCNVHGGFIYAIMIFGIMLGGHLVQFAFRASWPDRFVEIDKRGYLFLLAGAVAVILVPAIFSPYGFENLIHPFIIAMSEDGAKWRSVIEWKPIYKFGFGNRTPYIWFLCILGGQFLVWLALFLFFKPKRPLLKKAKHPDEIDTTPWPRIDLASLGVMAITIAMSIQSRRFIFLGGLVLSPFMAQLAQDIINMISVLRKKGKQITKGPRLPASFGWPLAGISLVAAIVVGGMYLYTMNDLYLKPHPDGQNLTVFRRMVGIDDQPVKAMKFFDSNKLKGVVLNEWTNGGFVPFWQTPNPETGEPPARVYMDGRAQAAYHVSHFERSNTIRHKKPPGNARAAKIVSDLAKKMNIVPNAPNMHQQLAKAAVRDKAIWEQVQRLARGDPKLFLAIADQQLQLVLKEAGFTQKTANWPAKLLRRNRGKAKRYNEILSLSVNNQTLYEQILLDERLNILLLSFKHSSYLFEFMMRAETWRLIYIDDRYCLFIRKENRLNPDLADKPLDQFVYADGTDDFTKNFTLGFTDCISQNPARWAKGLDRLMHVQEFDSRIFQTIWSTGRRMRQNDKLYDFFLEKYLIYKKQIDSNERFARWKNINGLLHCCQFLQTLSQGRESPEEAARYKKELDQYLKVRDEIFAKLSSGWIK